VEEIRRLYEVGDVTQQNLAEKFDVHRNTIWLVLYRKIWK
jgi:predicted DNA-binding protein (UPF0251 family)